MTEDTKKQPSTFWLKAVIIGLLMGIAFVAGLLTCNASKPKPPEGALIYERSLDGRVVNIWKKVINGIAQKVEYKEVKPDTEYLLDTVYFPKQITKLWGIGSIFYNPQPLPSAIFYRDTNGTASAMQFMANLEIAGALRITTDSAGKPHIEEAPINLQPKVKRTVLSVGISGGAQYGQVDTLWRVAPRFETYLQYSPWDFLKFRIGLGYPWGAFATATWEIGIK